jgi:hypothetical protein
MVTAEAYDGRPHIFGFSPAAFCINLTSALASARRLWSVIASINADTLNLVGLVLLSAIHPPFAPIFSSLLWRKVLLPFQKLCHRLDIQIRLVHKRHVSRLRHDRQL